MRGDLPRRLVIQVESVVRVCFEANYLQELDDVRKAWQLALRGRDNDLELSPQSPSVLNWEGRWVEPVQLGEEARPGIEPLHCLDVLHVREVTIEKNGQQLCQVENVVL